MGTAVLSSELKGLELAMLDHSLPANAEVENE
jgi:hypothetical protein